jgi:hypothetical protein
MISPPNTPLLSIVATRAKAIAENRTIRSLLGLVVGMPRTELTGAAASRCRLLHRDRHCQSIVSILLTRDAGVVSGSRGSAIVMSEPIGNVLRPIRLRVLGRRGDNFLDRPDCYKVSLAE